MQQAADTVYEAARRAAVDGIVSLAAVQADPQVQARVSLASRVMDIMGELEGQHRVRMTCRHPEPRWRITAEGT